MTTRDQTAALCALLKLPPRKIMALAIDRLAVRHGVDGCGVRWEAEARQRGFRAPIKKVKIVLTPYALLVHSVARKRGYQ